MKRPISIPLWFCIIVVVLLIYDSFIVPFIGELSRQSAVTDINKPSTVEHEKLANFLLNTFTGVVESGRQDRTQEHVDIHNDTQMIKNDTHTIILMLQNGTD